MSFSRVTVALALAVIACAAFAVATPTMVTHEADLARAERLGFTRVFRSAPSVEVSMTFAVRQKNMDRVSALVAKLSDPRHPKYGQHLSFEEVGQLTRDDAAVAAITSHLRSSGINKVRVSKNGDFVHATCTVIEAERAFGAEFHAFERDGVLVHRSASISLPVAVSEAFDYVSGLHSFHQRYSRAGRRVISSKPNGVATSAGTAGDMFPSVYEKYYGFPSTGVTNARGSVSVFEALGQSFSPADLTTYESTYNVAAGENVATVIGPNTPSACAANPNNCGEANLDVQVIVGAATGVPLTFWSIDQSVQDIFGEWIAAVANDASAPLVHSISYGGDESEEDVNSAIRFDQEIQKLALRGISVLASSGDDGAPGSDGRNGQCPATTMPSFPASVPSITGVGATMGVEAGTAETVCLSQSGSLISSGAGFSNIFPRPAWQHQQVLDYLQSGVTLPASTAFNASGLAYPHVVMAGNQYEIIIAGQVQVVSGTSASSPLFAAAVVLANEARLAAGKSSLGFLNPFLYNTVYRTQAANFVTSAGVTNNCCANQLFGPNCCTGLGFTGTSSGWNPLVGIGSINVPKFIKLALQQ